MPIETWIEPSGLFGMGAGPVSPITNIATQGAAQGAASGLININPLVSGAMLAYNLYRGLSDRQKAESQKRDNLFYLTLDEMRKAGEDPYEQYPEDLFDVSQYPEFAGIAPSGSPEEMRRETINAAIYNWRERNQDIVQQAYDAFLRSGLDYDEYKKRLEEGEPVVEEEVSLEPDPDLTPQQTFEGLEEEQKIGRINDALEKNPNASLADILDILTSWNIPTDLFRKATGTTPEEYVAQRDGAGNGADESDTGEDIDLGTPDDSGDSGDDEELGDDTSDTEVIDDGSRDIDTTDDEEEEDTDTTDEEEDTDTTDEEEEDTGTTDGDLNDGQQDGQIIPTGGEPAEEEEVPEPVQAQPQLFSGLFDKGMSATRTTDEIFGEVIGRLIQPTGVETPQYLLSGISQRFRV